MKYLWGTAEQIAPSSQGRHVWYLTQTSLKVKVTRDKKLHF